MTLTGKDYNGKIYRKNVRVCFKVYRRTLHIYETLRRIINVPKGTPAPISIEEVFLRTLGETHMVVLRKYNDGNIFVLLKVRQKVEQDNASYIILLQNIWTGRTTIEMEIKGTHEKNQTLFIEGLSKLMGNYSAMFITTREYDMAMHKSTKELNNYFHRVNALFDS